MKNHELTQARLFTVRQLIERSFKVSCMLALLACLALLGAAGARAQNTADIIGTVTDASGAVVPGSSVTLTNTGTNISQSLQASAGGDYTFTLLVPGTYALKVEAKGFKTFSAPSITVAAGDRARVDAPMEVGEQSTTVEVQAAVAPALQTDTSTLGNLVTSQAVEDIPLNGRNFMKLVQLAPGVTQGTPGVIQSGTRPDDRRQTAAFSANGQSETLNNQMIDGMDNNERIIGTIGVRPSVDAIEEVNVSTNLYDASASRTAGGVVDVITKSGSNSFHGSAYEFFRNKVLNTNPNYQFPSNTTGGLTTLLPKPAFQQNQYGGSIGGPIKKDKTFFFGDFEQSHEANGLSETLTVPTLCNRGLAVCPDGNKQLGDFSDQADVSPIGGGSACKPNTAVVAPGNCVYVVVPAPSISPLGLAFFNLFPLPTNTAAGAVANNYSANPLRSQNSTTFDMRFDQHISDKDSFFGRYSFNNVNTYTPGGFPSVTLTGGASGTDPAIPSGSSVTVADPANLQSGVNGFPGPAQERQQGIGLSYVHIFRPDLLLNLKAGYLRSSIRSLPINGGTVTNSIGIPCNSVSCVNPPGNTYTAGLVDIATAYTELGNSPFLPLLQFDNTFQYSGALTWNKGAHSIKIGLGLIRRRATIGQSSNAVGTFNFGGVYTGFSGGDLLEGLVDGGGNMNLRSDTLVSPGFRTWEPSVYVQDDWRTRRWLTLNLGMRYDIYTPYTEVRGRIVNWNPVNGLLYSPSLPGNQQSSATAGVQTNYLDIAPRFGFRASLKHNTVIGGGFGLSFYPTNYASGAAFKNAPYNFTFQCLPQNELGTNATCSAPYAGPAVANFGILPCNPSAGTPASANCPVNTAPTSSQINQTGGSTIAAGIPAPVLNVNSVFAPAVCTFVNNATYSATCPNNPYATSSISEITWPHYATSYLEQFNLQVQKEFSGNVVSVGYVGELGRHQGSTLNMNSISNYLQNVTGALPLASQFPWLAKNSINPNYDMGTSSYNSMQASFQRRFSKGLTVNFGYTWSHNLTDGGGGSCNVNVSPQDLGFGTLPQTPPNDCYYDNPASPANPIIMSTLKNRFGVGNSGEDVHNRFTWTANYQIPFGKSLTGVEGVLAKGWAANVAGSWQTGLPFTATSGPNNTGVNVGNPDQTCSGKAANPTLAQWFNASCFEEQQDFVQLGLKHTYGNELANQLFGPSQRNMDFSLFKEFSLREGLRMQFRTEVFNLFNTPNFSTPSVTAIANFTPVVSGSGGIGTNTPNSGPPVGAITTLNSNQNSRQIQFALKLLF